MLLTRDHQRAEDLVQTALAKTWGSWERVHGEHEAYVRRILVNEFISPADFGPQGWVLTVMR